MNPEKQIDIIFVVDDRLYCAKYEGYDQDILQTKFHQWQDAEYLTNYFIKNDNDLKSGFFDEKRILDAVPNTIQETLQLFDLLIETANSTEESLEDIFQPLHKGVSPKNLETYEKLYGTSDQSWLRLYEIKLSYSCYIITGGAIKLVKNMDYSPETKAELERLDTVRQFLIENNIEDSDDIVPGIFEI